MHFTAVLRKLSEPPAMSSVRQMLKTAMRANNSVEKTTLKAVMAAVKNADIAKPGSVGTDLAFAGVLNSLIKKRVDSAEEYHKGQRSDLADQETAEVKVLEEIRKTLDIATPEQVEKHISQFFEQLKLDLNAKDAFKQVMANLPKNIEEQWRTPKSAVVSAIKNKLTGRREYSTSAHENPLGLRRRSKPGNTAIFGGSKAAGGKLRIPNVNSVILVSSAKGGVGKSTVSTNLALSLQHLGYNTGLLDIDIFGPSIPKMLGLENFGEPKLSSDGTKLLPMIGHGVKAMSMGFLVPPDKSVSWRGLLVQKALQQLLFEVEWGPTEYLIVDMPPGTGDVQLTVGQQLSVDGAILVSTPQEVALMDARRGLDLFNLVKIPVLGLVENMAYFECPCCNTQTKIFGESKPIGIPTLASIPLQPAITAAADAGKFVPRDAYLELAKKVVDSVPEKKV